MIASAKRQRRSFFNPLPGALSSNLDAQRFRLSGARTRRNPRALNAAYHERIHHDQSDLIPLDPEAFIEKALELLASDRYLERGINLMALTGRRPAEIFFSAKFSSLGKHSPILPPSSMANSKPVRLPAPASSFSSPSCSGSEAPFTGYFIEDY
jgi:hypothetical protein